jgi:predicted NBD/HSP70 family sugar kinase
MNEIVRVIEGGGGRGFRRADVINRRTVQNFLVMSHMPTNIQQLIEFAGADMLPGTIGIAVTTAGKIRDHNTVVVSPHLHFLDDNSLADMLRQKYQIPATVGNDMETEAMGQIVLLPDKKYFMIITIGGGIGYRVVKNGKIVALETEGGHMIIDTSPFASLCGCGARGCVESIASGTAVEWRVKMELQARGIPLPEGINPCKFLDDKYEKGLEWAIGVYEVVAHALGLFFANIQTSYCLPLVVYKGSFALNAIPLIESRIRRHMQEHIFINPELACVTFQPSSDPENCAMIGAADLLISNLRNEDL